MELDVVAEDIFLGQNDADTPSQFFHRAPRNIRTLKRLVKYIVVITMQLDLFIARLAIQHRFGSLRRRVVIIF